MDHLLSWIIWLPVIGMGVIALIPRDKSVLIKQIAAVVSGLQLLLAIYLWYILMPRRFLSLKFYRMTIWLMFWIDFKPIVVGEKIKVLIVSRVPLK